MPRIGRKPIPGPRQPDGRRKPDKTPADAVGKWKRIRDQAGAQALDPRWASAIGQLMWFKKLTDREAAAADRWAEWVGRHDRIKGFPRRCAASPLYGEGYGPVTENAITLRSGDAAFLEKFAAARKAAIAGGGIMGVMTLDDAAVLNQSVGSEARFQRMQAALRALMQHWFM